MNHNRAGNWKNGNSFFSGPSAPQSAQWLDGIGLKQYYVEIGILCTVAILKFLSAAPLS